MQLIITENLTQGSSSGGGVAILKEHIFESRSAMDVYFSAMSTALVQNETYTLTEDTGFYYLYKGVTDPTMYTSTDFVNVVDVVEGRKGDRGSDGTNGADGTNGTNGTNGADGADGADGINGINGADGNDGNDGADGTSITPQYSNDGNLWFNVDTPATKYMRFTNDGGASYSSPFKIVGDKGDNVLPQYSTDGSTWHDTSNPDSDVYIRFTEGDGYTDAFRIAGKDADNMIIQYSIDGNTMWHSNLVDEDLYWRWSTDGGVTFSANFVRYRAEFDLTIATPARLGVIKPDGVSIVVDGDGVLSAEVAAATKTVARDEAEMMGLSISSNLTIVTRTDTESIWYLKANDDPTDLSKWEEGASVGDTVSSFTGAQGETRTGAVVAKYGDYLLEHIATIDKTTGSESYFECDNSEVYLVGTVSGNRTKLAKQSNVEVVSDRVTTMEGVVVPTDEQTMVTSPNGLYRMRLSNANGLQSSVDSGGTWGMFDPDTPMTLSEFKQNHDYVKDEMLTSSGAIFRAKQAYSTGTVITLTDLYDNFEKISSLSPSRYNPYDTYNEFECVTHNVVLYMAKQWIAGDADNTWVDAEWIRVSIPEDLIGRVELLETEIDWDTLTNEPDYLNRIKYDGYLWMKGQGTAEGDIKMDMSNGKVGYQRLKTIGGTSGGFIIADTWETATLNDFNLDDRGSIKDLIENLEKDKNKIYDETNTSGILVTDTSITANIDSVDVISSSMVNVDTVIQSPDGITQFKLKGGVLSQSGDSGSTWESVGGKTVSNGSVTDCNIAKTSGFYTAPATTINKPTESVKDSDFNILVVYEYDSAHVHQRWLQCDYDDATTYTEEWIRSSDGGNFTDWKRILNSDDKIEIDTNINSINTNITNINSNITSITPTVLYKSITVTSSSVLTTVGTINGVTYRIQMGGPANTPIYLTTTKRGRISGSYQYFNGSWQPQKDMYILNTTNGGTTFNIGVNYGVKNCALSVLGLFSIGGSGTLPNSPAVEFRVERGAGDSTLEIQIRELT